MKIVAHTLVKNEENFVWFAINSVIDYVDEIVVWDNGSSDKTVEIIKSINNSRIKFEEKGETDAEGTAKLRQKMLDKTDADWIFLLDGDEIWWEDSIEELTKILRSTEKDIIVTHPFMLIGDVFHYQEEAAGRYHVSDKVGHYNVRAIRKAPGLHVEGVYGNEGFVTKKGTKVQDLSKDKLFFFDKRYLHVSHLKRSANYHPKVKYELGDSFPLDFYYPEVFFKPCPSIVPYPWLPISTSYKIRASLETPLKKIKRRII